MFAFTQRECTAGTFFRIRIQVFVAVVIVEMFKVATRGGTPLKNSFRKRIKIHCLVITQNEILDLKDIFH